MNAGGKRAGGSGAGEPRVLVFTTAVLCLELELLPGRVFGQVLPPGPARIQAESADGAVIDVEAGEAGFFALPALPLGRFRLHCDTPAGHLVTDWVCR